MTQSEIFDYEYLLAKTSTLQTYSDNHIVAMADRLQNVSNAFNKYLSDDGIDRKSFLHYKQHYVDKTIERMREFKSFAKSEKNSFIQDFKEDLKIDLNALKNLFRPKKQTTLS